MFNVLMGGILFLTLACVVLMVYRLKRAPKEPLSWSMYIKLILSGIVAFIADTIGLGSFAVNTALAKGLNTFADEELPAMNNGAQVIPGAIESIFFMQLVSVDMTTLGTLVLGTCLGGLLGGMVVSKLSKQAIRLAMIGAFSLIIILLSLHQLQLLPMGGDATALTSWKLGLGFLGVMIAGALTSVGVGLFAMVQAVLFLLHVSPLVAFPIMTTAGAMQQPLTTMVFVYQNKVPLKKVFVLSLAGCIGVIITIPLFTQLTLSWLHSLLLCILFYNLTTMIASYLKARRQANAFKTTSPSEGISMA